MRNEANAPRRLARCGGISSAATALFQLDAPHRRASASAA
jgi:hypothetical protein